MSDDRRFGLLGMRAQIALALVTVLALAATLAIVALRPLTTASTRTTRRRTGIVLTRAIAGQVSSFPRNADLQPLLDDAVGPGALGGAAVLDGEGRTQARSGALRSPFPAPPFEDSVTTRGDALAIVVPLPGRGAFVGEVALGETAADRTLFLAVILYSATAAAAALWAVFVLLTRYTVRPVEALTRAAERVAAGRREVVAETRGAREVVRAAVAFNAMTAELAAREQDLSSRVEQLERATRDLKAAQDQLVRSERLAVVGRLSAGIAHEVGNPLAAIVGLTDVLKEGGLTSEESTDFADRIGKEAQRIHRTVRDLLDYARAAPDPASGLAPSTVDESGADVAEAVAQVSRLLGPQKSMREVQIETHVASALPPVRLASDRMVQVLLNLVLNAADAMRIGAEKGSAASVSIRVGNEAPGVVIEVQDTGPGIPSEIRARVFEPFFTTKPAGEGTGLGLAICAVIVEQAGGSIRALARTDGASGARIRIELPAA